METIEIQGAKMAEIAAKIVSIHVGEFPACGVTFDGKAVRFDEDEARGLELIAADAVKTYVRKKKPSMAKAAEFLRSQFSEARISADYALSFAR